MITLKSKNNLPLLGHRAIRKKEEKKKEWSGNCGNKIENIKRKKKEIEKYKPEKFSFTINSNHKEQIRII